VAAVFVMLAVTAYPIAYAVYLSLQRADLRFPGRNEFIGLAKYVEAFRVHRPERNAAIDAHAAAMASATLTTW